MISLNELAGYRIGTRNLVISGLQDQFNDLVEIIRKQGQIEVKLIDRTLNYEDLPSIINDKGNKTIVYLVYINDDVFRYKLDSLAKEEMMNLFSKFDSVDGIYWVMGTGDGHVDKIKIKHHGKFNLK